MGKSREKSCQIPKNGITRKTRRSNKNAEFLKNMIKLLKILMIIWEVKKHGSKRNFQTTQMT